VNLVGYCVDKGQHMLIYEFMSNGSLANLLYGKLRTFFNIYLMISYFCGNVSWEMSGKRRRHVWSQTVLSIKLYVNKLSNFERDKFTNIACCLVISQFSQVFV
jgi:hypothetical protein